MHHVILKINYYHCLLENITPRSLPISLQGSVKHEVDAMVAANIIAPVSEPTRWMKRNNKLEFAWTLVI